MPANDGDLRARILSLQQHQRAHLSVPTLDEFGVLRAEGRIVFLSPSEQRLAQALLSQFAAVVEEANILREVFDTDDNARKATLRICVHRLRKHLAPLGLTITCVRNTGYILHHTEDDATHVTFYDNVDVT
jgi:two-component system, OmpR family, response regulator